MEDIKKEYNKNLDEGTDVSGKPNGEPLVSVSAEPAKPKKGKTIEVDAETLQTVLDRVSKLEQDNQILREAADQKRLGRVEELRLQGKLVKTVKLNTIDGQIIVGWKTVKDDVYFDAEGRLHETQIYEIYFFDKTVEPKQVDIRGFNRLITKVDAEVLEESKDRDGNTNFTVMTKDGREIKLDSKFVN